MSSIQTGIELNDQFTGVLYGIINSVNLAVYSMQEMQSTMSAPVDSAMLDGAIEQINQATMLANEYQDTLDNLQERVGKSIPTPTSEAPDPVSVQWQSDNMNVFNSSSAERFQQEVQSTNSMLNTLNTTQAQIQQTASGMDILPDAAVADINTMGQRLQMIQQRIQAIETNPVNVGTDQANAELEQLRSQLNQAISAQNDLNSAMGNMDVGAANSAYMRLSQTVGNTERYIRDNVGEQGQFNQEIRAGTQQAGGLIGALKGAFAAYATLQTLGKGIELSDTLTQTTARLDLIVDDGGSVEELQNEIFMSAQNARGSYLTTADAVSKMGMQASQAFSSNDELIGFTELLNKSFVNSGTSVQGIDSVMLQLTQSMAAGKLQGEELNAVLDNAAPIVQNIQRYLEEVQGVDASNIKELASDGVITAEIIKNAMFYAADDINAKFESMPMTWGQIWTSMQNDAMMAFTPVLQRINDIANSEAFQIFVNNAIQAMATLANIVLYIFDLIGQVGGFIADNWSIISPIVYGVAAAMALYTVALLANSVVQGINNIQKGLAAVAAYNQAKAVLANAAAHTTEAVAAAGATVAQASLNTVLAACPLTWIILLIIALIAIIFAVCGAIAHFKGIAESGFGVIMGGVFVVGATFKNLGMIIANIALGIGAAIEALTFNIMAAFNNAICSVQAWFYDLLSTALTVVESICEALNKLPFVEFDYSGITSAANEFAAKSAEAQGNKLEYQSIGDAFDRGFNTFDTFQDGWASDAFDAGAAWGDGIADKVSNFSLSDLFGGTDMPNPDDYSSALADSGMAGNLDTIAENTGEMKDSVSITGEELKYMRDLAEQETVNRHTVAEVTVDMSGMQNIIKNDGDIAGFVSGLTDAVNEAVDSITEGVHI